MAKANPDVGLNPFSGQLQILRKDSFNYHNIESGHEVLIPADTEYILTQGLTLDGGLELAGSLTLIDLDALSRRSTTTITSDTTLTSGHDVVLVDSSSSNVTVTLPTAVGLNGKQFHIKNIDATNIVTVDGNGSETIDGALTHNLNLYSSINIISNGTEWLII